MTGQYLAVDTGSSSGKVLLAGLNEERKLKIKEMSRFSTPRIWINGHLCINVYGIYDEICKIVSSVARAGINIESIGVDSWASDFGFVNREGELEGLPVFYRDKRTEGMEKEVEKKIDYKQLYSMTSQRKSRDTTLCQMIALQKEHPNVFLKDNRFMHIGDLLMFFFTGKIYSEISAASYSQLFNLRENCWENRIFDLFNIPRNIQPPVVAAGSCLGRISEQQAAWYGSNRFEVIAPAVHDTASAGVAVPAKENENWAFIATGSWYLVSMEIEKPANSQLSYRYNLSNTGLAFGKTLLKRNVCAMWILQECKKQWERMGLKCDYAAISGLAQNAAPFCGMIDTEDEAFYNPDNMVKAVVEYLEKTQKVNVAMEDIGQISRIVYESIAFKCKYALQVLQEVAGVSVDILYIVGGVSEVPFLNQMLASATNLPVATGLAEASAVGNTLLQMIGTKLIEGEMEAREIVRKSFHIEKFYPAEASQWDKRYEEFLDLCKLK